MTSHPAAGGRPQAALLRPARHADRPAAVRERLHHLHAHRQQQPVGDRRQRRPPAGPRPLRPGVRPGRPAPLRRQGQERAGGARGDPPLRRRLPHARRAGPRAVRRRAAPLRADLAAHRRLARWPTPAASPPASASARTTADGHGRRVRRQRPGHHLPRLPARLRRGHRRRRPPRRTTPSGACPRVSRGDALDRRQRSTRQGHTTSPPARYTEASLVKRLEELGIGRPSTYASIITTIQDRGYVWKKGSALVPTWLAFAVVNLLEQHFGRLVDYGFTASHRGRPRRDRRRRQGNGVAWLSRFYFGSDEGKEGGLARQGGLKTHHRQEPRRDRRPRDQHHPDRDVRGRPAGRRARRPLRAVRPGRRGRQRGPAEGVAARGPRARRAHRRQGRRAGRRPQRRPGARRRPDHRLRRRREGRPLRAVRQRWCCRRAPRTSRRRRRCSRRWTSRRSPSSRRSKLLTLPRVLGDAEDGEEVTAHNGRYGPYVSKGKESRSLESEEQLFEITLEQALALLAQPKQYGRKASAPKPPLKELGDGPGHRREDGRQGGPLRALRHRRRDQRLAAQGRRPSRA